MINQAILMGRLTRDPELRNTNNGTPVCGFTVAVDNGYGDNKRTDFINCVAWRSTAEFVAKYFTKGTMIIVDGRIRTRTLQGQDGCKNYVVEVIANKVDFGETKIQRDSQNHAEQNQTGAANVRDDFDFIDVDDSTEDDLPF